MAATSTSPRVRHEEFCLPRPDATEPRVEIFPYLQDNPATGRSTKTHTVTRCLECGAAHYERAEN